jgi:hypothetical protein
MKQDSVDEAMLEFMLCGSCATQLLHSHDAASIEFVKRSPDRCATSWCGTQIFSDGHKVTIIVQGADANQVQEVSLALVEKTKQPKGTPSPWASGSFYLIVFVIIIVALAVVGRVLPLVTLPTVFIGGLVALSVIGALQMRQVGKLSEENFLKLMTLSFKNLPWLVRKDPKTK